MRLLLILVVLLALAAPAMAAGITIPAGLDVGIANYIPMDSDRDSVGKLTLTLMPFPKAKQVDAPTSFSEILPWAKANLGIPVPFEGDAQNVVRPVGVGISEQVRLGSIGPGIIRAGVGWTNQTKWAWIVPSVGFPL